jgi:Brp/Blh family beta-carotene 15,15'-monooxygenase
LALLAIIVLPFGLKTFGNAELFIALLLFFGLGIPHGALDAALGRSLFEPVFGKFWWLFFLISYLICVVAIVYLWLFYPLTSFLFFLVISALHFGFSDTLKTDGLEYILEGFLRGILPIAAPAYFYPEKFRLLVENDLTTSETTIVMETVQSLFYPNLCLFLLLIVIGFIKKDKKEIWNILEILSVMLLFFILTPFRAFLIYFCFLHSLRHILSVLEEMNLGLSRKSLKWILLQALPSTLSTLFVLATSYWVLQQSAIDSRLMYNLFFISLAALTFPHMLVVELVKRKT